MRVCFRIVAPGLLSVFVLIAAATMMTPEAYAQFTIPTPTITPASPTAGQPFTVSGSSPNGASGDTMMLYVIMGTSSPCSGQRTDEPRVYATLSGALTYSFTDTLSAPGYYCLAVFEFPPGGHVFNGVTNGLESFFVGATSIPEYPLGLPILAMFMVVAYGFIRRRAKISKRI